MGFDVAVLGSANLDVVLGVEALPAPGETVLALSRTLGPGGKGANQAIAAARSGARTAFVGALGDDEGGALLRAELSAAGVDLAAVRRSGDATGTAYVMVDTAGENAIVVDAGANAALRDLSESELGVVRSAGVLLCQLEVPVATVTAAAQAATGLRVLNAAPACPLPGELTDALDVLVVNAAEALAVSGERDVRAAVAALLVRVPEVVVTLGADGVLLGRRDQQPVPVAAVPARAVVDTTGAGDVFCGAFCAARAGGAEALEAVRVAAAASSLSVERHGAGASAPTADEVRARLADARSEG